jgi:MFS family permease
MSSPAKAARTAANIVAISALGATAGSGVMVVGAGRDALMLGYETTLPMLAWLTAAVSITFAGMQIPAGWLVDRWGPRRVAYLGAIGTVVFYTVAMLTPSFELALVVRVLAGVSMAFGFVSGSDLVRALSMPAWVQGLFGLSLIHISEPTRPY